MVVLLLFSLGDKLSVENSVYSVELCNIDYLHVDFKSHFLRALLKYLFFFLTRPRLCSTLKEFLKSLKNLLDDLSMVLFNIPWGTCA